MRHILADTRSPELWPPVPRAEPDGELTRTSQGRPPWGCRSEAVPASCCLVKGGVWGTKAAGNFCDSDKSEDRTVGGVLTWCYNI